MEGKKQMDRLETPYSAGVLILVTQKKSIYFLLQH